MADTLRLENTPRLMTRRGASPPRAYRLLVVDDDPDMLKILGYILTAGGYEVAVGYGGEDALRKLRKQSFDLILTDLAMPVMSGIELIEIVRSQPETRHIPILAVTAHIWEGISRVAAEAGCDGFVSKPVSRENLLRAVDRHVRQSPADRPLRLAVAC